LQIFYQLEFQLIKERVNSLKLMSITNLLQEETEIMLEFFFK
jgi:hypothetical protein